MTRERIGLFREGTRDKRKVVRGGVEPPTFRFSGGRSYQLSYLTEVAQAPRRRDPDAGG